MSEFIYRTFRYRLYPNTSIQSEFHKWFGCRRKVYNEALEESIKQYEQGNKKFINRSSLFSVITKLKNDGEHEYLKEVPIHTLQSSVENLLTAYQNFFRKTTQFPRFKIKYEGRQSFKVCSDSSVVRNCDFENCYIWLPKLKQKVKFKMHRPVEGELVSYTITHEPSGKWFVSIVCKVEKPKPKEKIHAVGLDFGILDFITDSDGRKINSRKFYRRCEEELKLMLRALSRKEKGSKNYNKIKRKIARVFEYVRNARKNDNDKISSWYVNNNQVICIEDLKISNMSKNHKLAKSLLDEGWYQFTEMLRYKMEWYGGKLVKIDRFYPSSKTCSACGHKMDKMPLNVREWVCPNCGTIHDRDVNASQNILVEGLRLLSC